MRAYAYLRASTNEQDAERTKIKLANFSNQMGLTVSFWFIEYKAGSKLDRLEFFRLLEIADPGDILLVEQVD